MAGIPHDHYEPKPGFQTWLHNRLPIVSMVYDTLMIPTPKNLNWMWIWGIVLAFCLALQIVTGVVLAMHYTPHVDLAFRSVEHIMRDVNGGYMIRYIHANGASLFFAVVSFMPNFLGDPVNYVQANPLSTPAHIVPEWYFLPFYAILRAFTSDVWVVQLVHFLSFGIVDAKFFGVVAMFGAIAVMAMVPWLDTSSVRSGKYRPKFKAWFWLLVIDFVVLMWVGAQHPDTLTSWISLIAATYWFAYFLVILPLLGVLEKPLPQPATIEEDFKSHYADPAE